MVQYSHCTVMHNKVFSSYSIPEVAHKLFAQQETSPSPQDFCQDGISLLVSYIAS